MSIWSNVPHKTDICVFIFCLADLYKAVNGVFRSPTMIVFLSVSPFISLCAIWCIYIEKYCVFLMSCPLYHYKMSLSLATFVNLKSIFVRHKYGYPCFSVDAICLENRFPPFLFQSIFVFAA